MPNVAPTSTVPEWDDESVPSSANALTRKKIQTQKRDGNSIDNVLGVGLASFAIAVMVIGIINLINKQRKRVIEDEEIWNKSDDDEATTGNVGRRYIGRCRCRRCKEKI